MSLDSPKARCPVRVPARRGLRRSLDALVVLAICAALPSMVEARDAARSAKRHSATQSRKAVGLPAQTVGATASVGFASVYSQKLEGRRMANGAPLRLDRHNAASTTLPMGSTAVVTNLANGERAVVTITDRGPFVRGRIIDLTPHTAKQLGIGRLARVEVAPIASTTGGADSGVLAFADSDLDTGLAPR